MLEEKPATLTPSVEDAVLMARKNLEEGSTRELSFVKMMLASMMNGKKRFESELLKAMIEDLRVDEAAAYRMSIHPFFQELRVAFYNLETWYEGLTQAKQDPPRCSRGVLPGGWAHTASGARPGAHYRFRPKPNRLCPLSTGHCRRSRKLCCRAACFQEREVCKCPAKFFPELPG